LPGRNEFEQLDLVFKLLGTPTEQSWPGVAKLGYFAMMAQQNGGQHYESGFERKFGALEPMAKDLLRKLLAMDPSKRISAKDALDHDYFWTHPLPTKPEDLPKYPACHEFTAKKRRQQQAQAAAQNVPPASAAQQQPAQQRAPYGGAAPPPQYSGHQYQTQHHYGQQQGGGAQQQFAPPSYGAAPGAKRGRPAVPGGFDPQQRGPQPPYGSAPPPPQQQHQGRPPGFANGSYGR